MTVKPPMTLTGQLTALEYSGLIRLAAGQPAIEYIFRDALTQEAAHASLVKADRKHLHLAVGETLERIYADRLTLREHTPLLGQHLAAAGEDERALELAALTARAVCCDA